MGIRSLASLLVFRAFAEWKKQEAARVEGASHTLLGLEEPEAHLHPQAQRSLFRQIRDIPGQRIVSTHSPYFAGQAALEELRLFRREQGKSCCTSLDMSQVTVENRRKLEQAVVATRGDILFSRAVVLFEGVTEEQALPIMASAHWGATIHELGLSFVSVGGDTAYYPFIWLAHNFSMPWFIISDSEANAVANVEDQLRRAGCPPISENPSVVVLPGATDIEGYLIADGYLPQVEAALVVWKGEPNFLNSYMEQHDGLPKKKGVIRDYSGPNGRHLAALDVMRENKAALAPMIGRQISTDLGAGTCELPSAIRSLFDRVGSELGLPPVAAVGL